MINKKFSKKGQIWVETVIYTLIALVLIATVLSFAKPKIESIQDQTTIEQSIQVMKDIDVKIQEILATGSGNKRILEVSVNDGQLKINGLENTLEFTLQGRYQYGEYGIEIPVGRDINVLTTKKGDLNNIRIFKDYSDDVNFTISNKNQIKTISSSAGTYEVSILNKGEIGNLSVVDFNIN